MQHKAMYLVICLSLPILATAKDKTKTKVDTTPNPIDNVLTGTVELNYYNINTDCPANTLYINPTIDYSATNGWDFQIASYNIELVGGAQNNQADTYLNISKTIQLPESFMVSLGTQNGISLIGYDKSIHNVEYGLLVYQPNIALNLRAGTYWANKAITTTTDYIGFTGGFSINLLPNLLTFVGDYFSGANNLSGGTVNAWVKISPMMQFYIGVGVPETNSGNEFYGTTGFSTIMGNI